MLERELDEAARIARRAGELVLGLYHADYDVEMKGKNDPVTEADKLANDHIVAALRAAFPDDGVVAEESLDRSDATARRRCWFVDPLDGTKEFIAKNGEFAVMLGLAIDGESQLGVVYQPVFDKLYRGVVGQGATLERAGTTTPLSPSDVASPADLKLVVSRSHRARTIDEVVRRLGIAHETRSGSVGLKIGIIAERTADLYVHYSDRSSLWDTCGPEAVLRAAGGRFSDLTGAPYRYDRSDMRTVGGILACNAAAYEAVLPVAHAVAREAGFLG